MKRLQNFTRIFPSLYGTDDRPQLPIPNSDLNNPFVPNDGIEINIPWIDVSEEFKADFETITDTVKSLLSNAGYGYQVQRDDVNLGRIHNLNFSVKVYKII